MLLSKLRFALCLFLCVGFLSGNAQVYELTQELKSNARKMSIAGVKDPARDKPYEITASGNVISFYKTITTVVNVPSSDSRKDRIDQALKEGRITPEQAKRLKERAQSMSEGRSESTGRSGRSGSTGSRSRAGSTQNKTTTKTERKLMARLDLSKVSPSSMNVIKRSDRVMLDLKGKNVLRYYDTTSKAYKFMDASIIHLYNSIETWKLENMLQKAVFTAVPKRNMNLRCTGSSKTLKRVKVDAKVIMENGNEFPLDLSRGSFVVNGSSGTLQIRNIPIGAKIGVWIIYPSDFDGERSDGPAVPPTKTFLMPPSVEIWNRKAKEMGGTTFRMGI